ncbi:PREDICTED: QWRF motif-containing protein 4-like [Priapulus caudatus]|uniref:QWRF motif-containing protein 4-like n=1 Tax=Priapulus caudatus TaxID=37621 RepID=A0ABM1EB41_PRICU|nr:PREDICTED: QWRF motif-containing protein 4-like [Priapulus caudatus]
MSATSSTQFHTTPKSRGSLKAMSTPATASAASMQVVDIDISAVVPEHSYVALPESRKTTSARHVPSMSNQSSRSSSRDQESKRESKAAPSLEDDQLHLQLLYSRYMQWAYMDTMSKKACDHQEADAQRQMYQLWQECERLDDYKSRLDLALDKVKHIKMLEKTIAAQNHGLAEALKSMSQMKDKYANMAASVEATYHHLPTHDHHIPDDPTEQSAIVEALVETEALLHEITSFMSEHTPALEEIAGSLAKIEDVAEEEVEQLTKCDNLLTATMTLAAQEASMKVHLHSDIA